VRKRDSVKERVCWRERKGEGGKDRERYSERASVRE